MVLHNVIYLFIYLFVYLFVLFIFWRLVFSTLLLCRCDRYFYFIFGLCFSFTWYLVNCLLTCLVSCFPSTSYLFIYFRAADIYFYYHYHLLTHFLYISNFFLCNFKVLFYLNLELRLVSCYFSFDLNFISIFTYFFASIFQLHLVLWYFYPLIIILRIFFI